MKHRIRDATPRDGAIIASNNSALAEESESHTLDPDVLSAGVLSILDDSTKGRYWVAELHQEVIGQIMVTYEWSDWRNGMLWWIQSVYVHPEHRRGGVFSSLYRHVESAARDAAARGMRLYVDHDNSNAQDTYKAMGMMTSNYEVMEVIFGEPSC